MKGDAQPLNPREEKGLTIAQLNGQVQRVDEHTYTVKSQSGNGEYQVYQGELGWICSCCDHMYRGQKCKHIFAVEFSIKLRERVRQSVVVIASINTSLCIACGSDKIVKDAVRHNKYGDIQRYRCKSCNKRFSFNIGFEGMRATPQMITSAMQLYFSGESLRNVQKFLAMQGVKVSHMAVYRWIGKYVGLMEQYLSQIKPQVSDTWRADEMYIKVSGNLKYLFAMMDDETRYWIAAEVADGKHTHDARGLFAKSKELAGKRPVKLVTDGLHSYHEAYLREFRTAALPRTQHIRNITISGQHNNNKMERMNGEVRDREKVMRGLKKKDTVVIPGYQLYHNYFRSHEGLNGQTPAEAAGIKIEGTNKWVTVIQNAASKPQN